MQRKYSLALGAAVLLLGATQVRAQYEVQVGYADNIRSSPFFPNPWIGGANVDAFVGDPAGSTFDSGAIRVINNGPNPITFKGLTVDGFGDGTSYTLWNSAINQTIAPGHSIIFAQVGGENAFDVSDHEGGNPAAIPQVHLNIDNVVQTFADTAQVLNTEGTDALAQAGLNESHQWRDIGTFGGQAGSVPDAGSTVALLALGVAGLLPIARRARK